MGQRFCRPKKAPGRGYSPREALVEASGDGDSVNPNLLTERRSAAEDDGERGRRKEKRQRRKKFWRRLCCIDGSPSRDADKPKVEEIVQVQAAEAEPSREISDDPISLQDITFTIESHEPKYFEWVDGFPSSLGQINTETSDCLSEEIVVPTDQADTNEEPVKEDILSKYKMGYKLGQGGYGSIYTALRLADNLPVAVKIAQKSKSMEYINIPDHPTPVPLEIGLTFLANKGPSSPQIIQLLDWQDNVDKYIMVLQRPVPCMDLLSYISFQRSIMDEDKARRLMEQVVDASITCCNRGVLHRDIKLENILVNTDTLEVTLIDFGCGALLHDMPYDSYSGTRNYCPPEYLSKGKYYGRSGTVYSLGVLLFFLVCEYFPDKSDKKKIKKRKWIDQRLSKECCHLLNSCLHPNPMKRIPLDELLLHDWFQLRREESPELDVDEGDMSQASTRTIKV